MSAEMPSATVPEARLPRWYAPVLALILTLYLALACFSVFNVPILNGPDEHDHLRYVQALRSQWRLPVLPRFAVVYEEARAAEQAQHPPLYYAALAAISYVLPDLDTGAGQRCLKLLSALMGLASLLALSILARRLWPGDAVRSLGAVAAVAFLPNFFSVTCLINNTAGSLALGAVALLLLWQAFSSPATKPGRWFWTGLLIALAMMAKITALWLLPVALLLLWVKRRRNPQRVWPWWRDEVLPLLLPVVSIVGVWLFYNVRYFAVFMPERVTNRRYLPDGIFILLFSDEARNLLTKVTFVDIPLTWVTPFWLLRCQFSSVLSLGLLALYVMPPSVALLVAGCRRWHDWWQGDRAAFIVACGLGALACWGIAVQAVLHDWNTGMYAGRYAIDGAPALGLLWVAGLGVLLPRKRWQAVGVGLCGLILLVLSVVIAFWMRNFFIHPIPIDYTLGKP